MNRTDLIKDFDEHFDGTLKDAFLAGMAAADKYPAFPLTKLFKKPSQEMPKEDQWCIVAFVDHLGWHLRDAQWQDTGWAVPGRYGMSNMGPIVAYWAPKDYNGNLISSDEKGE